MKSQAIHDGRSIRDLIEGQFAAGNLDLPVFNPVALKLRKLVRTDKASMSAIANLVMKDQALAGNLLGVANSSFYGGLRPVETITAALVRLGTERVVELAMLSSQLMAHATKIDTLKPYMSALWSRSFVCAIGARWTAEHIGYGARAEEAFLAGLLHDIGELYLIKVLEKLMLDQATSLPITASLTNEILDSMHAEFGYRLMSGWEIPETYARIARDHHAEAIDETDVLLVITRLLDTACLKLGIGQTGASDIVLAVTPEAQILGLKEITLAQLEVLMEDALAAGNKLL